MKLWHISRPRDADYDEYVEAVVSAETEAAAREMHPAGDLFWTPDGWAEASAIDGMPVVYQFRQTEWDKPSDLLVEHIGESHCAAGVICASFRAG